MKAPRLLMASMALAVSLGVHPANRCEDLFSEVASRVESGSQFEKDFGAGVFVRKASNEEFLIEPPPEVARSIRQAQLAVGKRSQSSDAQFTVLFEGFSEGEVIGFKAMLSRDAKIKGDGSLSAVLLGGESVSDRSYEGIRDVALAVRDRMNRRYQWAEAKVEQMAFAPGAREERYLLTAKPMAKPEEFLLKIRLRTASMLKNRTSQIISVLSRQSMVNATSEQVAYEMISSLKKGDAGISSVTLKVIAGDFVIAQPIGISGTTLH